MNIDNNKAIYLQIADRICDDIMSGALGAEDRLPSVREYAALVQVNPNTVMRSYEQLSQQGIIYNKRGIGYFVSPQAHQDIYGRRADTFRNEILNKVFGQLKLLGVSPEQLAADYSAWLRDNTQPNPSFQPSQQ